MIEGCLTQNCICAPIEGFFIVALGGTIGLIIVLFLVIWWLMERWLNNEVRCVINSP